MTMAGKAAEIYKYGPDSVSSARSATSSRRQALRGRWSCAGACPTRSAASTYSEAHEGYRGNTGGFSVSAHTKELIEEEVKRFIDEGYANASRIIEENAEEFERLAQGLLEYETLTGEEIKRVMRGDPPQPGDGEGEGDKTEESAAPSVTAIPKTKPRTPKGGMEPEPSA